MGIFKHKIKNYNYNYNLLFYWWQKKNLYDWFDLSIKFISYHKVLEYGLVVFITLSVPICLSCLKNQIFLREYHVLSCLPYKNL